MNDTKLVSVQQVRQFLEGNEVVEFRGLTALVEAATNLLSGTRYNW